MADLVTELLPVLSRSFGAPFNVFDVMHHGTHEKQLSNVFGWLLDTHGTHHLEDAFLRIFVDEVNEGRPPGSAFPNRTIAFFRRSIPLVPRRRYRTSPTWSL